MRWVNHKLVTGAAVFALTGNLAAAAPAMLGAIIPDAIEGRPPEPDSFRYQSWRRSHRQLSHWFPLYLLPLAGLAGYSYWRFQSLAALGFCPLSPADTVGFVRILLGDTELATLFFLGWFFAGGLGHLLEDALCGTIPGLSRRRRFGVRLFTVGSPLEYLVSIALAAAALKLRGVW